MSVENSAQTAERRTAWYAAAVGDGGKPCANQPGATGRLQAEGVAKLAATTRFTTYMDANKPMVTLYAHEMGHRVMSRVDALMWDTAMTKAGVTAIDKYIVSEYAGFGGTKETFAEVHALMTTGQEVTVPESLRKAYEEWARIVLSQ